MRWMLVALVVTALSLIATTSAFAAGYATRTLKQGSSGSDVRALQRYLDQAGYDTTARELRAAAIACRQIGAIRALRSRRKQHDGRPVT